MIRGSRARIRAISQLERHETPDPVRSGAVNSRIHDVRQASGGGLIRQRTDRTADLVWVVLEFPNNVVQQRHFMIMKDLPTRSRT